MQALVIRISRDVYVLDITVNFMLNKRKSKKAAGASPQTLLLSRDEAYPPPAVNIFIRPPLSQNPGSAPDLTLFTLEGRGEGASLVSVINNIISSRGYNSVAPNGSVGYVG